MDPCGKRLEDIEVVEDVDSEVIIDFGHAVQQNPSWKPSFEAQWPNDYYEDPREIQETTHATKSKHGTHCDERLCCENEWIPPDDTWTSRRTGDLVLEDPILKPGSVVQDPATIPSEQLKILPYRTYGFILRTRKWGKVVCLNTSSCY